MSDKKHNVFVICTEYHFLAAMSIIDSNFFDENLFSNKLILSGIRLSGINLDLLPKNIEHANFYFSDSDYGVKVKNEVFDRKIDNLFLVHAYRPFETYILLHTPTKTRVHLMQDGALFYHHQELSLIMSRIKENFLLYKRLFERKLYVYRFIYFGRYMHKCRFIDELWMTNPTIFKDPKTTLKINTFTLFPKPDSVKRYNDFFTVTPKEDYRNVTDCLIYLAPIIIDTQNMPIEVEQIKILKGKTKKKNLIIKIHPNIVDKKQFDTLKEAFGDVIIQNFIPAELYIANATNSCVIGTASTSLFYYNEKCPSFALKKYYQRLGIYASWKNVVLPSHVTIINELEDFDKVDF